MAQLLSNARIVTPDDTINGSLAIEGEVIAAVVAGGAPRGDDMEGDFLIPGVIDLHTDNLEKHFFPRPNIDWPPRSAAVVHDGLCISVGVTTVFDSLSVGSFGFARSRKKDNLKRLSDGLLEASRAGVLKADHFLHWRCETTSREMQEMLEPLSANPLVGLYSIMDHTPGQRQYRNLQRFLDMWRGEGVDEAEIDRRMSDVRQRQEEVVPSNRRFVAALARAAGKPLAAHDDETGAHVDDAADLGATIAEFPVTEEAARRARERGMAVFMGGPNLVRGGSYSGNVQAAEIADKKLLDGFASDYVPRSLIECAFRLAAEPFCWPLPKAIDTVTGAPARAAGLSDRGVVEEGKRADLLRVRIVDGLPIIRGVWTRGARVG